MTPARLTFALFPLVLLGCHLPEAASWATSATDVGPSPLMTALTPTPASYAALIPLATLVLGFAAIAIGGPGLLRPGTKKE